MRRKKLYLFRGRREFALSKEEILRAHNIPCNHKNMGLVVKVKKTKEIK